MPAVFYASDVFVMKSRQRFIVIGKIGDGTVRERMKMRIDGHPELSLPIVDIGLVKKIGDRGVVALSTPYRDSDELALLEALHLSGKTIAIDDATT